MNKVVEIFKAWGIAFNPIVVIQKEHHLLFIVENVDVH